MEKQTLLDKLGHFNEQLNLTHYWIIFLKYKKLLFVLPIFFGLLGYLVALNIKPVFQSNATLVIEADSKKIVDNFNALIQGIQKEKPNGIKGDFVLSSFINISAMVSASRFPSNV